MEKANKPGRKHSEETKRKLSELAKKRHAENPGHNRHAIEKIAEMRRNDQLPTAKAEGL